jgi:hypothetical protein
MPWTPTAIHVSEMASRYLLRSYLDLFEKDSALAGGGLWYHMLAIVGATSLLERKPVGKIPLVSLAAK